MFFANILIFLYFFFTVIYLTATMLLGTLSIVMTVFVLNIHHRTRRFPVPRWAKKLMLCYLARFLCVQTHYSSKVKHSHRISLLHNSNNEGGNSSGNNKHIHYNHQNHHQNHHRHSNNSDYNKRRRMRYQNNNGILDEMESMGLTAVLNTRQTESNGPMMTSLPNNVANSTLTPSSRTVPNPLTRTPSSDRFGFRRRLSEWTSSFKTKGLLSGSDEDEEEEPDFSRDWHELARVLDRVFFWMLFVFMGSSAVFILLYPKYSGVEQALIKAHANNCTT